MDRLKADLESLVRESGSGTQNDVTELVRTVAGELDIYVNARFTKVCSIQIVFSFLKTKSIDLSSVVSYIW